MNIELKNLVMLANHLDATGLTKEADYLDKLIKKEAMIMPGFALLFTMLTGCGQGCNELKYDHMIWFFENGTIQTAMPIDKFTEEEIKVSIPASFFENGNIDQSSVNQIASEFDNIAFKDDLNEDGNYDSLSAVFKKLTFDLSSLEVGKSIFQGKSSLFGTSSNLDYVMERIKKYEKNIDSNVSFEDSYKYKGTPSGSYTLYFGLDTEAGAYATYPLTEDEMKRKILDREGTTQTTVSSG